MKESDKNVSVIKIDVEKALPSPGVWNMIKKGNSSDNSSCTVYKELTWDDLDDLEYRLNSMGIELSDEGFPDLSRDYTLAAADHDHGISSCLISSFKGSVLWVNMLISFEDGQADVMRLVEKLALELWLTDDERRPSTVILPIVEPGVETLVNKIFDGGYTPEKCEASLPGETEDDIPAETYESIRRDMIRKLTWWETDWAYDSWNALQHPDS